MHATIRDDENQQWEIELTPEAVERIRDRCFFTVPTYESASASGGEERFAELFDSLLGDRNRMLECLWATCIPQAQLRGITREQFAERLANSFDSAERALIWVMSAEAGRPGEKLMKRFHEMRGKN